MTPRVHRHTVVESPLGELTLVSSEEGLCGLFMEGRVHAPATEWFGARSAHGFEQTREELAEYFAGERHAFQTPLAPEGTDFQRRVWALLERVPYGETWSYREAAERLGTPSLARAVGAANGRNPVSILIPCHRLVGSGGSLTGYGGGVAAKEFLLRLEGAR